MSSSFDGHVDYWSEYLIEGWAIDKENPEAVLKVELWDGADSVGQFGLDQFRSDLQDQFGGSGFNGFRILLPKDYFRGYRHTLQLRLADSGTVLRNGTYHVINRRRAIELETFRESAAFFEKQITAIDDLDDLLVYSAPLASLFGRVMESVARLRESAQAATSLEQQISSYDEGFSKQIAAFRKRYETISLDHSLDPIVSIIIPVHRKFDYTYRCLKSIESTPQSSSYEIIVSDDYSLDDTMLAPTIVRGNFSYSPSQRNLGFVETCNRGASIARGRYLFFLNNDTEVKGEWLDALVRTFSDIPDTGIAGSKLVYPDGRLQEAGGIIWRDGSGWNYGHLQDPKHPRYNYARDADWVSGASLMIPAELFRQLGGFDLLYRPAYYEDTDLCFRTRALGKRVIYQPLSEVVHHEGVSAGTSVTGSGMKRFQSINSGKFYKRWRSRLQRHRENSILPEIEKERDKTFRVLFVDETTPTPREDAGSQAAMSHIRALDQLGGKITFVPSDNMAFLSDVTPELQRIGVECLYAPFNWSLEEIVRTRGSEFDLVYLHRFANAVKYLGLIRRGMPKARVIYNVADLHFLRMQREHELDGSRVTKSHVAEVREAELAACEQSDLVIVHSEAEKTLLGELQMGTMCAVVPWELPFYHSDRSFEERSGAAFVGGYRHPPNVDAVEWFISNILQRVIDAIPDFKFLIVGSHMPKHFESFRSANVVPVGFVENLDEILGRARLTVAPLRYGAGMKGKVAASLAAGLPCVATSIAAEGMNLRIGAEILVADEPSSFASAIIAAYTREAQWMELRKTGLSYARQRFSREAIRAHFATILETLQIGGAA